MSPGGQAEARGGRAEAPGGRAEAPGAAGQHGTPAAPDCPGDVCITCSDTAAVVTVLRLLPGGMAVAGTGQGEEEVSVALVPARPGDRILVHAKEAIAVLPGTTS